MLTLTYLQRQQEVRDSLLFRDVGIREQLLFILFCMIRLFHKVEFQLSYPDSFHIKDPMNATGLSVIDGVMGLRNER
jgi:hypothetical protein